MLSKCTFNTYHFVFPDFSGPSKMPDPQRSSLLAFSSLYYLARCISEFIHSITHLIIPSYSQTNIFVLRIPRTLDGRLEYAPDGMPVYNEALCTHTHFSLILTQVRINNPHAWHRNMHNSYANSQDRTVDPEAVRLQRSPLKKKKKTLSSLNDILLFLFKAVLNSRLSSYLSIPAQLMMVIIIISLSSMNLIRCSNEDRTTSTEKKNHTPQLHVHPRLTNYSRPLRCTEHVTQTGTKES